VVWLYVALGIAVAVLFLALMWWVGKSAGRSLGRARVQFVQQREHLEADFLRAAQASGKPRGLIWVECEWTREVEWGRDRQTGQLLALVGVTIRFEAVAGSDMEGLPAVGNLRTATGLFFYEGGRWHTTGVAVFNHNPQEVLSRFERQYERLPAS